jgi:hypothetical protein
MMPAMLPVVVALLLLLQSVLAYHLGHEHLQTIQRRKLSVAVTADDTDMYYDTEYTVTCTATGGIDTPYLSFFWLLTDDTSLPLSANMPGVSIESFKKHGSEAKRRPLVNASEAVSATLVLNRRFYEILNRGTNVLACHAYTFKGQQAVQYFTINKV